MDKQIHKAQTVVDMSEYKPETGYAAVTQVEAYWTALRGTNLLPKRSEIDPRGIETALENAFILERIAPGIARLRIAGNHLNDLMGMEVRGMPLTALFSPPARRTLADLLEDVFQTPARSNLHLKSGAIGSRPAVEARMVLLPLKSDLGDVSRILGCLVAKGEIGLAPRRFDIVDIKTVRISADMRDPVEFATPPTLIEDKRPPVLDLAEPKGLFQGKPKSNGPKSGSSKRPPYLKLVKTEK